MARDDERKPEHAEAMVKFAMIRLMAARLAGQDYQPSRTVEREAARRLDAELADERPRDPQGPIDPTQ